MKPRDEVEKRIKRLEDQKQELLTSLRSEAELELRDIVLQQLAIVQGKLAELNWAVTAVIEKTT